MIELPHSKSCFVCGSRNPIGLKIRFQTDERIVQARFQPRHEHAGFLNVVHGGLLATLLDELMVWACAVRTRRFSYCAEMTVRFLAPAHPEEMLTIRGELVENKRERLFLARGEIQRESGEAIATSAGKYIPVKDADVASFIADFEGGAENFHEFFPAGY